MREQDALQIAGAPLVAEIRIDSLRTQARRLCPRLRNGWPEQL
jgi:hypothetical protein